MVGDAASITIIENTTEPATIFANIKTDGSNSTVLMIPAGGTKIPTSPETAIIEDDGKGNMRCKDNLVMKGDAVYNFVQVEVPPMINSLMELAKRDINEVDYFMFHQPNKFMLQKLADKMKVAHTRMPNNVVEHFGNASGVSIPTAICFNLEKELQENKYRVCLAGFGVGLTWSSMLMELGGLDFCEIIYY